MEWYHKITNKLKNKTKREISIQKPSPFLNWIFFLFCCCVWVLYVFLILLCVRWIACKSIVLFSQSSFHSVDCCTYCPESSWLEILPLILCVSLVLLLVFLESYPKHSEAYSDVMQPFSHFLFQLFYCFNLTFSLQSI